jgi:hypothetical protein
MKVRPARLLNEKRGLYGFNEADYTAAGVFLIGLSFPLTNTPYMLLAFPTTGLLLLILYPVRMNFRRRIIRDTIGFYLTSRRIYDPKLRA